MKSPDCPICEWDDAVVIDEPSALDSPTVRRCSCLYCGARFKVGPHDSEGYRTVGERLPDEDQEKETEFQLRESAPGSHAIVEGGRGKGEYVRLVEDRPYVQSAWACLRTGRVYHYSWLLDSVWRTEVVQASRDAP